MQTILTGIRVNGELTLGNYLGALLPMVRLANQYQKTHQINIFIPDLHTIIAEIDGNLQQNIRHSIKSYLAAGLEVGPNVHFYRQSQVPAHSELNWILNCFTTMGELSRMTQFKEKSAGKNSVNLGIFSYPVLMAADILLYDATFVPVGEDQFQHLELTRNLAERINHRFGEIFTLPLPAKKQLEFMGQTSGIRIRDLSDPTKKMSKSNPAPTSKIMLNDQPSQAAKKILSATTDSLGQINFDFNTQPGISNLLQIESLITNRPLNSVIDQWSSQTSYGQLKTQVSQSVYNLLLNFQDQLAKISDQTVEKLLLDGENYANSVANQKLKLIQSAVGLR